MRNSIMTDDNNEQKEALRNQGLMLMNGNRLEEAKALFMEIGRLYPEDVEAWYMLSSINGRLGNLNEAADCCRRVLAIQPDHSKTHVNLGNVLHSQGKLDAAADSYMHAIQTDPNLPSAYVNLGNLRLQQKYYEKAANNYKHAIDLTPAAASLRYSLGVALSNLGRNDEAMASFQHAIQLKPDYADAYNMIGTLFLGQGNLSEALEFFQKASACAPNSPQIYSNMGVVYHELQQYDMAVSCFGKALEIDPRFIAALNNLGTACRFLGQFDAYFAHYRKAVSLLSDPKAARIAFAENLKYVAYFGYSAWLDNELVKCFSIDDINHNSLAALTARALKHKYSIHQPLEYDDDAIESVVEKIAADDLFMMFLGKTTNVDSDLEMLLTSIRRTLLIKIFQENNADAGELRVAAGIAHQCFNNEYVFAVEDEELRLISTLKEAIEKMVPSHGAVNEYLERYLLAFCMYENLYTLSCKKEINAMPAGAWSESFRVLLKVALTNPLEEEEIQKQIASVAPVKNDVSRLVQAQYEENPYPRWLTLPKATRGNIRRIAKKTFPHLTLSSAFDGQIRILVAGCGTGQHPILTSLTCDNADILAVDISKSSLAYAIRMARSNGIRNIQFMQADILDLSLLDTRFHMIECVGVLHHMENPVQGWKILSDLLIDDGIMSIGLYSEKGREQIVAARKIISDEKISPDKQSIRNFRRRVLMGELGDQLYGELYKSYDFYSISRCRDLLFNFMEHRFTIPQLATIINDINMEFIGFKFETSQIQNLYRSLYPDDKEMTNLFNWDQFEQEHQDTFGRMYQFWCRKRSQGA